MALSHSVTASLNFIALMCSIPIISTGIWLSFDRDNDCVGWLRWPFTIIGAAFLVATLLGFLGAYFTKKGLLRLYLVCMLMLLVLLLVLLVLANGVAAPSGAHAVPGAAFQEYRLDGFSSWLREQVYWDGIRRCVADSGVCERLNRRVVSSSQFFATELSPIESGCCKPPLVCGFQYCSPTKWMGSSNIAAGLDCLIWSNDGGYLCYDCGSCKAGVLENLRRQWRRASVVLVPALAILVVVYLTACYAYMKSPEDPPHPTAAGSK